MSSIGAVALKAFEQIGRGIALDNLSQVLQTNRNDAGAKSLHSALTSEIYSHFYICDSMHRAPADSIGTPENLLDSLLSALPTGNGIDWDWRVAQRDKTSVIASRKGWVREFLAGEYLSSQLGGDVGFPIGVSQSHVDIDDQNLALIYRFKVDGHPLLAQQVRFYFHAKPAAAARCLHEISHALADWDIPHSIKCPIFDTGFSRSDALVLYLDRRDVALSSLLLVPLCDGLADALHTTTPLFALPLRPGIAFAESPRDRQSFGMSRSGHCAAALEPLAHLDSTPAHRIDAMIEHFSKAGIDLAAPHLNDHSSYPYCFHELGANER